MKKNEKILFMSLFHRNDFSVEFAYHAAEVMIFAIYFVKVEILIDAFNHS